MCRYANKKRKMCQVYIRFAPVTVGCQVLLKRTSYTPPAKIGSIDQKTKNLSGLSGFG